MRKIISITLLFVFLIGGCAPNVTAPLEIEPEAEPIIIDINDYQGVWYPEGYDITKSEYAYLIIRGNRCIHLGQEEREVQFNGNTAEFAEDNGSVITTYTFGDGEILAVYAEVTDGATVATQSARFVQRYSEEIDEINKIAAQYANAMKAGEWNKISDMSIVPLSAPDEEIFAAVVVSEVSLALRSEEEDSYCYDFTFEVEEPGRTVYRIGKNERYLWIKSVDGEWKVELTTGL